MAPQSWSQETCLLLHWLSLCSWTFFPPLLPFKQKAFLLFFSLQPHPDIFCGFLVPYSIGFVRGDSSPLHCYFQEKGYRQAAGAASLVPLSSEAADGANNVLEKSSWACWHGSVRHPNLSCCPKSLNPPPWDRNMGLISAVQPSERSCQSLAQRGLDVPEQSRNAGNCSNASQLQ